MSAVTKAMHGHVRKTAAVSDGCMPVHDAQQYHVVCSASALMLESPPAHPIAFSR